VIVYISGPVTGIPDYEPPFTSEEELLINEGHTVINPCNAFRGQDGLSQALYMRFHIHSILMADAMVLLPGWKSSKGAQFEEHMARTLNLPIYIRRGGELILQ